MYTLHGRSFGSLMTCIRGAALDRDAEWTDILDRFKIDQWHAAEHVR